jgi:hypothetical protein
MHDRRVNQEIVVDELGRARAVREYAADGPRDEVHSRPVDAKPLVDRGLIAKIEVGRVRRQRL